MKLFLMIVISGFFMSADSHPDKKCYASVYCLPWDATGDNHDYTLEWAQVYPPLCETAPDQFGDSTSWNTISAQVYEQIEDLEKECEMLNASLYRETERVDKQIMTGENKLGFLEEEINETIEENKKLNENVDGIQANLDEVMQNCTDELVRQQNVKIQWLQTMEAAIDKNKELNESLVLEIREKEELNESLIETKIKLDEAIEEKQRLNESLIETRAKLDEERSKNIDVTQLRGETIKEIVKKFCPVFYDDKCFSIMIGAVYKKEAESICTDKGGKLGNIYDETHLNKIMSYVRENYLNGRTVRLWLGMTYENKTVYLSDRTETKYSKWHANYPSSAAGRTSIILFVRASTTSVYQYMANVDATKNNAYPFCEI